MSHPGVHHSFPYILLSEGILCKLDIIDPPGQEKFRPLSLQYLNSSNIIIIIYDITDKSSFDAVSLYYKNIIKDNCTKNQRVILLGNKTDLELLRQVSINEGKSLAEDNNYVFMEVSCLKNKVKKAMEIAISIGLNDLNKENYQKKDCSII